MNPEIQRDFKFFTGTLKAYEVEKAGGGKDLFLEGVASSTVIDRQGDRIASSAQNQMLESARGMTMFLNHEYTVPDDVFGTCEESYLKSSIDLEQGECIDLCIRVRIEQESERAVKCWKMVKNGTKLGFSIGGQVAAWVTEDGPNGKDSTFVITGINLFEISCVGIPANQRAQIADVVAKSARKKAESMEPTDEQKAEAIAKEKALALGVSVSAEGGDTTIAEVQAALDAEKAKKDGLHVATAEVTPLGDGEKTEPAVEQIIDAAADAPVVEAPAVEPAAPVVEAPAVEAPAVEAAPVVTAEVEVPTVKDGATISADTSTVLRACMDSIHKSMTHSAASAEHKATALSLLGGLIPPGLEQPPEPGMCSNESDTPTSAPYGSYSVKLELDTAEAEAKAKSLAEALDTLQKTLTATETSSVEKRAELEQLTAQIVTLKAEALALTTQAEAAKATRKGRKTVIVLGARGSSEEQTASDATDPEVRRHETEADVLQQLHAAMNGAKRSEPADARSLSDKA